MSQRKKNHLRPFVPLRRDMMRNQDYRKLRPSAKVIYAEMRLVTNGNWKEAFPFPYSKMLDVFSRQTIANALKELEEKGFVRRVYTGSGTSGIASHYKFKGEFANPFK